MNQLTFLFCSVFLLEFECVVLSLLFVIQFNCISSLLALEFQIIGLSTSNIVQIKSWPELFLKVKKIMH